MELQKREGGRTGEQNETQYVLTFSNCKTSFSARHLTCQLALLISARRTVKEGPPYRQPDLKSLGTHAYAGNKSGARGER